MRSAVAVAISIAAAPCLAPPAQAAPGDLDVTFGSGGRQVTDLGGYDTAVAVAIQPDGKLVVVGSSLARFTADGRLDPTFSGDGIQGDVGGSAIALQPDGKIVVAGTDNAASHSRWTVTRRNPDGSPDTTFSGDGRVTLVKPDFEGYNNAVAIQPDGKIGVAGQANVDFGVARYTASGTLDPSFGDDGTATFHPGTTDYDATIASAMVLQPDGKIVLAGISQPQWTCDPEYPYCDPL